MNIDSIIKKEGIKIIDKLPTLQVNHVAKSIAEKLSKAFPEHDFNQELLFSNIARLNMYIAEMPNNLIRAKYVSENNSIYFNSDVSLDTIDDLVIHECLHYLQEIKDEFGRLIRLGLANFYGKVSGIALNEAAVQLMAAEANKNKYDSVTYYNIQLQTNTPSYYTLECALLSEMAYFTGTYPLYNSTLTGSSLFENTFIAKSSKSAFNTIKNNLEKMVEYQDILSCLTYDLQTSNGNIKKISQINKTISFNKKEIENLFYKTQNLIMTECFNYEFKNIRNVEELDLFKERLQNFNAIMGTNPEYTYFDKFYNLAMSKFEEKYEYFQKHSYINFGEVQEKAIALVENKIGILDFIKMFIKKFKKLNGIKQENIKLNNYN